jgi:hypothetical protein
MANHFVEVRYRSESPKGYQWEVWNEQDLFGTFGTKFLAKFEARTIARWYRKKLVIKNKDGRIGECASYGHDREDRPG